MKKHMALLLCLTLLVGLTACGKPQDDTPAVTTQMTTTTTVGESTMIPTTTTTAAGEVVTATTTATTTAGTTGGDTVATTAIPTTTTTATQKPTTEGTQAFEPVDPTTATIITTTTMTTTVVTQPTEVQPQVVLPAVGSDIDVANRRGRIRVSAATATVCSDGTIAVSLTFQNYSSNWITEETDWVEYTCYDKNGKVVQAATKIAIGCIDTKKNAIKTFTFDAPASTAEVRLTNSKIVYWTEWA